MEFLVFINDAIAIYAHTYLKMNPLPMKYLYMLYYTYLNPSSQ